MRRLNIIGFSESKYCNPFRIAIKNDETVRLCSDARFINEIIESEGESPPIIQELVQKFHGVSHSSTSDL